MGRTEFASLNSRRCAHGWFDVSRTPEAPCPWLDGKHVVFGHMVGGEEVLDAIEALRAGLSRALNGPLCVFSLGGRAL